MVLSQAVQILKQIKIFLEVQTTFMFYEHHSYKLFESETHKTVIVKMYSVNT